MQRIKHAFRFIGASFSLALKHPQLQEPWFTLGVGSLALLFVWFLAISMVIGFVGVTPLGLSLTGLLVVLAWVDLVAWGEITALLTARAMNAIDREPTTSTALTMQFLKDHGGSILFLTLVTPVLLLGQTLKNLFSSKGDAFNDQGLWLKAHTLALPVIAEEQLSLNETIVRLRQIVKENLLPIREKLIPVRWLAGVIEFLCLAAGVLLAFWLGFKLSNPQEAGLWQRIMAVGIAMLVAWLPTLLGILFSSFTRSCYATALYQWVRNVETARSSSDTEAAQPPAILRQVLGAGLGRVKDN